MKTQLFAVSTLGLIGSALFASAASANPVLPNYNYVGLGVGIGDVGNSDVGLAITSKISVADNVSVRPNIVSDLDFSDGQTAFQVPVTYDFNAVTANGKLFPYAGGGIALTTGDDSDVGPLLTAGVDYRLTEQVTLNGAVNWAIYDKSQVNGVLSVGYTF